MKEAEQAKRDAEAKVLLKKSLRSNLHFVRRGSLRRSVRSLRQKFSRPCDLRRKRKPRLPWEPVIAALEETLLNNPGTEGFSVKLGGFGKFKVRHLKPVEKRVRILRRDRDDQGAKEGEVRATRDASGE